MFTERRVVTVLALATILLVGFLLYSGREDSSTPDSPTGSPTTSPTDSPTASPSVEPEPAVAPVGAGRCPEGARVKGETDDSGERIYHRPRSADYAETRAEECFASGAAAEAAGYDPSNTQ